MTISKTLFVKLATLAKQQGISILTKRMMEFGPSLGMPHSRAMGEGLFELRLTAKEGQARVFYCTMVNNQIIMLHTFIKKTPKTPNHERELAKRRMREVKAQ